MHHEFVVTDAFANMLSNVVNILRTFFFSVCHMKNFVLAYKCVLKYNFVYEPLVRWNNPWSKWSTTTTTKNEKEKQLENVYVSFKCLVSMTKSIEVYGNNNNNKQRGPRKLIVLMCEWFV